MTATINTTVPVSSIEPPLESGQQVNGDTGGVEAIQRQPQGQARCVSTPPSDTTPMPEVAHQSDAGVVSQPSPNRTSADTAHRVPGGGPGSAIGELDDLVVQSVSAEPGRFPTASSIDEPSTQTYSDGVAGSSTGPIQLADQGGSHLASGPVDYSAVIVLADLLDDLEKARIANENRLRSLTDDQHGKGIPASRVEFFARILDELKASERACERELVRAVAASPLGPFVEATRGLGGKSLGRLLKEIGDPAWNYALDAPRTLGQLNAYCGLHVWSVSNATDGPSSDVPSSDNTGNGRHPHTEAVPHNNHGVAPFRRRGERANWSTQAKVRLFLIADSQVKVKGSTYRHVYDAARQRYADSVHTHPCIRCGPKDHPAQPGTALNLGHQHARALRLVMKALLRDMWQAAREASV